MRWILAAVLVAGCSHDSTKGTDGGGGGGDGGSGEACAAVTACTDGDRCCPSGCDTDSDNDCVAMTAPLPDRLVVASITTPAGVIPGVSNWRIWGTASLRVGPVYTVPLADCSTLVGYTTGTVAAPTARVAVLDATDQLVTTHDLGAFTLRGLAAEPDGHFAALLWEQKADPATNQLHVRRYTAGFEQDYSTALANAQVAPDDFNIGESRLEYGDGRYGAYFHVHGVDPNYFAYGHEGDELFWIDAATGAPTLGWEWGCSHSMSELLRYSPAANTTLPVCVTDCYPGTSGDFATNSIGGIYLDHDARKVLDVDAGCNGSVAGELGGLAPGPAGWKLVFNAHQNPATTGTGSYSASTMNQDIGFTSIASDQTPAAVVWLTTTPDDEANASIARWQPAGDDTEQYVVGWSSGTTYQLARVSATGDLLEGPTPITAASWGERDDPFRAQCNDDIVWAWFESPGATTLNVARLRSGN